MDIFLLNQFTLKKVLGAPFHDSRELEHKRNKTKHISFTKLSPHPSFVLFTPPLIPFCQRMAQQSHLQHWALNRIFLQFKSSSRYLFCSKSNYIGPIWSKGKLDPKLKLTMLASDLGFQISTK